MLAVVEDEQHPQRFEVCAQRLQQRPGRLFAHAEQLRRLAKDERRFAQRGKVEKPRAVRVLGHHFGRHLQRQPRLAQTAHAEQGQQSCAGQMRLDLVDFALASDERRDLQRQVVRDLVRRQPAFADEYDAIDLLAVWRGGERRTDLAHLVEFHRLRDALQHPVPVRPNLERRIAERLARLRGQQGLATAGECHHPGCGRLGQALDLEQFGAARHVLRAVLAQSDRPDVQARTRLQRHRQGREAMVVRQHIAHSVWSCLEEQQHAVALVDLASAPSQEQVPRDAVMGSPHLCHRSVAERYRQLGAVNNVGEKQGSNFAHSSPLWGCRPPHGHRPGCRGTRDDQRPWNRKAALVGRAAQSKINQGVANDRVCDL